MYTSSFVLLSDRATWAFWHNRSLFDLLSRFHNQFDKQDTTNLWYSWVYSQLCGKCQLNWSIRFSVIEQQTDRQPDRETSTISFYTSRGEISHLIGLPKCMQGGTSKFVILIRPLKPTRTLNHSITPGNSLTFNWQDRHVAQSRKMSTSKPLTHYSAVVRLTDTLLNVDSVLASLGKIDISTGSKQYSINYPV